MELNSKGEDDEMDMDMSNCPDCQLQMLQHQQQLSQNQTHQNQNQNQHVLQNSMQIPNITTPTTIPLPPSSSSTVYNEQQHMILQNHHPYSNSHHQNVRSYSSNSVLLSMYDHQTSFESTVSIGLNESGSGANNSGTRTHLSTPNPLLTINSGDFSTANNVNTNTTGDLYHYSNSQVNFPSSSSSTSSLAMSMSMPLQNNTNTHTTTNSNSNSNSNSNNITPASSIQSVPMEMCDLKSFCAACANLNPSNSTTDYYRSSLQRHSVYPPPIFYGQGMPVPGFSPVDTWGSCNSNDFGVGVGVSPYGSYTTQTPEYYSSLPPPPPQYNNYNNNNVNSCSSTTTAAPPVTNQVQNNNNTNNSCSFSNSISSNSSSSISTSQSQQNINNNTHNNKTVHNAKQQQKQEDKSSNTNHQEQQQIQNLESQQRENPTQNVNCDIIVGNEEEEDDDSVIPISISSNSEEEEDDSSSTSGESDSRSYISQNEVIVEDLDEEEDVEEEEEEISSNCNKRDNQHIKNHHNLNNEDKEDENKSLSSAPSKFCIVCQNPIGLSTNDDCASPQLSNILENIHDDITAEDLDISVSSGDIEIGGIEDEVRDFQSNTNQHHKITLNPNNTINTNNNNSTNNNTNRTHPLTISRLAYLLNIPVHFLLTNHSNSHENTTKNNIDNHGDGDGQLVDLCSKCGKLSLLIDSLEKELKINSLALKQFFQIPISTSFPKSPPNPSILYEERKFPNEKFSHEKNEKFVHNKIDVLIQTDSTSISFQDSATMTDFFDDDSTTKENIDNLPSEPNNSDILNEEELSTSSNSTDDNNYDSEEQQEEEETSNSCELMIPKHTELENGRANFLCEECGLELKTYKTFKAHLKRHHDELKLKCNLCTKRFISESSLTTHLRHHTKEKPFQCLNAQCQKSFSTKSNMMAHYEEICKKKNPHPHHEKSIKNAVVLAVKNDLSLPLNSEIQNNENDSNGISTNSNSNSNPKIKDVTHIIKTTEKKNNNNNSNNATKLHCPKCQVNFRLPERLDRHMEKECKQPLQCIYCPKKLSKQSEMTKHLLIHTQIRPLSCPICPYTAKVKSNLKLHMEIHSEEKRFKCCICNKGFNRKQALDLHTNRHNGFKPFSCKCGKKFFDLSNASKCKCKPARTKKNNITRTTTTSVL